MTMSYVIDTRAEPPSGWHQSPGREVVIVQVGCGGTGGFLAEAICRLLLGVPSAFYLVDMDRIEEHNVARQAFDRADVGQFKAQVLAERLARRFGREVGYSVLPYDHQTHATVFGHGPRRLALLVGAVDNAAARRSIAKTLDESGWRAGYPLRAPAIWWLDTGNGRNSGQVLLGNVTRPEHLRGTFELHRGRCRALPAPSLQRPDLLDAPPPTPAPDCAEAVEQGDQGATVNQAIAAIAAGYIEKLLAGTCTWMASYFDMDDGTLRCVTAEPKLVAEIAELHVNAIAPPTRAG
jgi:PRTRC genetic system ThiF family protein